MTSFVKKFSIGQIVYILYNKNQTILPALVVEEVTKQTLNGTEVSWKFAVGESKQQKIVDLTQINGDVYSSLNEIKQLLTERLNKYIDSIIKSAKDNEHIWYHAQLKNAKESGAVSETEKSVAADPLDSLITGPKELSKESLREKLKEIVSLDPSDLLEEKNVSSFIDENGQKINLHFPKQ